MKPVSGLEPVTANEEVAHAFLATIINYTRRDARG